MDILLGRVTQQAMNYAIRSGVTITATYAIKQCGRLLREAPRSRERDELLQLQQRLDSKIRIISPAIDMIELISARGNTSLESAVALTKEIRYEIQRLGTRLNNAANDEELLRRKSSRAKSRLETEHELKAIISTIKALMIRIEDAVPLINLAITTSGVNLSTKLSGTISPSRLLQASTFLTAADTQYTTEPGSRQQVGPVYTCSHLRPLDEDGMRNTTWKEVIHKARVKLVRVPLDSLYDLLGEVSKNLQGDMLRGDAKAAEFAYQLVIVEDLDDDRVHTFEENEPQPGSFDDVSNAGIRDVVPVHEVSKIFYADTGKILNIGGDSDVHNPVLLLKRDVHAEPPRRMLYRSQVGYDYLGTPSVNGGGREDDVQCEVNAQFGRESAPGTPQREKGSFISSPEWRIPADLDPEWIALEVYAEDDDSDTEDGASDPLGRPTPSRQSSLGPDLTNALSNMNLRSSTSRNRTTNGQLVPSQSTELQPSPFHGQYPAVRTSLSLLEMLMKLTALQQFRQESHLAIEDEILNFFLEDSATAGAGFDKHRRQRVRHDALRRVGFDPYDESPIKRRGEEYIQHARGAASPRPEFDPEAFPQQFPYDDQYGYEEEIHQPYPLDHHPYSRDPTPSSPSPRPLTLHQTPSRSSTPGSATSERHRNAVQAKYAGTHTQPGSHSGAIQTPPSTSGAAARSRQALLRAQTESKARSPLGRQVFAGKQGGEVMDASPATADSRAEAYDK
ncbi:Ran-specific GTPase-activating protein 30 [Recurvomyces mirabilis]|uniref:Ran-specific GTPase-activating protein 30 n=1 Tax=Recurvomyces mirabilis TaxID=574656 RepID=A0AAE0WLI7_9PEZI|nr:Ran-specific GTPase-activating protein 30 [Recurvomyces mirabilis]KAK5151949.1 Ran-specific GTPase-activating protein 30 [Recurvomyces mirabilis]